MRSRFLTGTLILIVTAAVILGGYFFDRYIVSYALCILMAIAILEMRKALGEKVPKQFNILIIIYAILGGLSYFKLGFVGLAFFMLMVFISGCTIAVFKNLPLEDIKNLAFILVYPGFMFAALFYINRAMPTTYGFHPQEALITVSDVFSGRDIVLTKYNTIGLVAVFAISWLTDTFAFLVGSLFGKGKKKLCPQLSPNKTVVGAVGGFFGGLIGATLLYLIFEVPMFGMASPLLTPGFGLSLSPFKTALSYIMLGLCGSFATQIGDLVASLVKRNCGIKDYSKIMGSHGGVMDRFDGVLLNGCFVAFLMSFIL